MQDAGVLLMWESTMCDVSAFELKDSACAPLTETEVTSEMTAAGRVAAEDFYFEDGYALTDECLRKIFLAMTSKQAKLPLLES